MLYEIKIYFSEKRKSRIHAQREHQIDHHSHQNQKLMIEIFQLH